MAAAQMRLSGNNTNPFELQKPNAPPNPFMSGSCDKHLSFFMPLRLRDFTICQGDAFHPSPWQTSEEEKKRVASEEEETMQGGRQKGREGRRRRRRGRKQPVIHSNTSSTLFAQLSLANSASSGLLQKEGFVIRVLSLSLSLSGSWLFTLAAN